jgi:hypothetical protein
MTMLDTVLSAHPGKPSITWKLYMVGNDGDVRFRDYVAMAQHGMPSVHGAGRCFAEQYENAEYRRFEE